VVQLKVDGLNLTDQFSVFYGTVVCYESSSISIIVEEQFESGKYVCEVVVVNTLVIRRYTLEFL
jgi:hypothetical protein